MTIQKIKTGVVEDNAITTSKVLDGSVTPEKLATSGILPALDGSQLTGIQSGTTEIIDDTVDPAIDTNPADGVGTLWANTTTGCLFCCTDATTDDNIWTRITVCTDSVASFHGTGKIAGYAMGGGNPSADDTIEKFSFTSDGDATDVGNLSQTKYAGSGQSSSINGYYSAGSLDANAGQSQTAIEKFSFTSDADSVLTSNLLTARTFPASQSSKTHGYTSGGFFTSSTPQIEKFQFASESNVVGIGILPLSVHSIAGTNSTTHGYTTGGITTPPTVYRAERSKFSFSSDGDAVEIGPDLINRTTMAGLSSSTDGYICGGFDQTISRTEITKHSFSSDNDTTDIGDIVHGAGGVGEAGLGQMGTSSVTHGYISGAISTIPLDYIDKFAFASGGNTTDVGVLQVARNYCSGAQV